MHGQQEKSFSTPHSDEQVVINRGSTYIIASLLAPRRALRKSRNDLIDVDSYLNVIFEIVEDGATRLAAKTLVEIKWKTL